MNEDQQERLAKNESLFRTLNENIRALASGLRGQEPFEFICECSTSGCFERLSLTLAGVRAGPAGRNAFPARGWSRRHRDRAGDRSSRRLCRRREGRGRGPRRRRRRPSRLDLAGLEARRWSGGAGEPVDHRAGQPAEHARDPHRGLHQRAHRVRGGRQRGRRAAPRGPEPDDRASESELAKLNLAISQATNG